MRWRTANNRNKTKQIRQRYLGGYLPDYPQPGVVYLTKYGKWGQLICIIGPKGRRRFDPRMGREAFRNRNL
jgi:hypothetical protein